MDAAHNPFAMQRVERIPYIYLGTTREALLERLAALEHRAAIVGPHGHGKSLLLEDLGQALEGQGYTCRLLALRGDKVRFSPGELREVLLRLTRRDILLLDGAEKLSWLAWRRFLWRARRAGGLLITTHEPGRLPTLHQPRTSFELLEQLLRELVPGGFAEYLPEAQRLFAAHEGDLRQALLGLYDFCADASSGSPDSASS